MRQLACLMLSGAMCLMAQEPIDYNGWMNQGVQQFKAARYADATASFERAAAMDPSRPTAYLYLGTSYMQQYIPGAASPENLLLAQRAEEQFRRVLEIDPRNKTALSSLASLTLNQKRFDEALGWYGKVIAADPANADAYYTLGFVAWSKWYPEYAKARASAGLKPQDPGPIPDAGVRQSLNSQYGAMLQAGIDALNKALELNPEYDDAMAYLNLLIRERADLLDSVAEYQQDVAVADQWVQKALAVKKAKAERRSTAAGLSVPPPPPPPTPFPAAQQRIRIAANVQEASLIQRVEPTPPAGVNVHGDVVLAVVIGREGTVQEIQVMQGHPMLIRPALDAVKQWKYRPTLLNGNPVEVATQVTLQF